MRSKKQMWPLTLLLRYRHQTKWIPPPQGLLKVNFDDAVFGDQNAVRVRILIRTFIYGFCKRFQGICGPVVAEITAAREAIVFAKSFEAEMICRRRCGANY
ncbi:hypothetical protein ACH5RR_001492 [Cinchona calisaya]|uniref:RNase H type-1 domain-containing protein n=1 Tax=Cinchona calisaya TaxID=153742 RepID=A0ABD3B3T7_9GENT